MRLSIQSSGAPGLLYVSDEDRRVIGTIMNEGGRGRWIYRGGALRLDVTDRIHDTRLGEFISIAIGAASKRNLAQRRG